MSSGMRRSELLFQSPCTLANVQLETIAEEKAPRDTVRARLIRTLSMALSVTLLTGFDCTTY